MFAHCLNERVDLTAEEIQVCNWINSKSLEGNEFSLSAHLHQSRDSLRTRMSSEERLMLNAVLF